MRRNEFNIENHEAMRELLASCEYGTLSLSSSTQPYGVPLNFVWWKEGIVFHGAKEGKKVNLIAQNPKASFCVVKPYAFIPSYFSQTTSACPATQFFASVIIEGEVTVLSDVGQKADALSALMQKLQPECQYEPIDYENPIYTKMLDVTAVFYLKATQSAFKLKMAQNLSLERKKSLIDALEKRGSALDNETIKQIRLYM